HAEGFRGLPGRISEKGSFAPPLIPEGIPPPSSLDLHRRGETAAPPFKIKEIPVKKTAPQKMTLSRETLGTLNDKDMKAILGGDVVPWTSDSQKACCANK